MKRLITFAQSPWPFFLLLALAVATVIATGLDWTTSQPPPASTAPVEKSQP